MFWITTIFYITMMQDKHSCWYWSVLKYPCNSVGPIFINVFLYSAKSGVSFVLCSWGDKTLSLRSKSCEEDSNTTIFREAFNAFFHWTTTSVRVLPCQAVLVVFSTTLTKSGKSAFK